mmetsp:Transcript_43202/g.111983  ORF Transcript_43202/g.111983 Transcript_43202/m.111983 type:complete len:432 (-) Transcript_43202:694-1989(-)
MRQVVQGSQGVHVGLPKRGAPRLQRALQQRLRLAVVSPLQKQPPRDVHQVGVLLCARRQQPHHRRHRAAQGALEHGVEARRAALVALDLRQYHVLVLGLECRRLLHLQVVHHLRQLLHLAGVQAVRQDLQLAGVVLAAAAGLDRLVVLLQTPGPREADALRVHHHQRALRARHRLRQLLPLVLPLRAHHAQPVHRGVNVVAPAPCDEALVVQHVKVGRRLLRGQAVLLHGQLQGPGHTQACAAGPRQHHLQLRDVLNWQVLHAQRAVDARQRRAGGPLDVVVEDEVVVAVALQQRHRLLRLEVLKLHEDARPTVPHCVHELIHELKVRFALQALAVQPDVDGVLAQRLVVGAHVDADGQDAVWLEARGGHVHVQLADGDGHAAGAQVTEAEDPAAVGHHDGVHLLVRPVVDHGGHLAAVLGGEEHPAGPPE